MKLNLESGINNYSILEIEDINLDNTTTKKITFNPEISDGDKVILKWKNGFEIVIRKDEGIVTVEKVPNGSYNEMEYVFGDTPGEYDYLDAKVYKEI